MAKLTKYKYKAHELQNLAYDDARKTHAVDVSNTPSLSNYVEQGGQSVGLVHDMEVVELMGEVLKQLKITNMHLAILSDNDISKEEI